MSSNVRKFTFSAKDYIEEFGPGTKQRNATLVPITIAAAALEYEPTTVRAHIRQGKLDEVIVDCGGVAVKGVTLGSLNAVLEARKEAVVSLAEELGSFLWSGGGRPIEYGQIMPMVGLSSNNPHHREMIGRALGHLSTESQKTDKFMISALVVLKATGRPNESFFYLAEEIGAKKKSMSNERFWQEDIERIKDWAGPQEEDD